MAGVGPSEPYKAYTGSSREIISRPVSPVSPASPVPARTNTARHHFSSKTPVSGTLPAQYIETDSRPAGLRRRPSLTSATTGHHPSQSDFDFGLNVTGHRKAQRSRDDGYNRDEDRRQDFQIHPDSFEKSRPPRSHRNVEAWERIPGSASKPYFEETRVDRDLERGPDGWCYGYKRRGSEDGSFDSYYGRSPPKINFKSLTPEERAEVMILPWTQWMNSNFKNHFVATIGEFVGTTMFLFFAFAGTQVANIPSTDPATTSGGTTGFNVAVYLYISVIFGFSLMVNVWIFFRISGGLFNPAVTLGMLLVGAIPVARALCLFLAQLAGGIAASAMVLGLFPTPLNVRTKLSGGASLAQGVFIEAILTAELVFTIFMLAKEKHKATFLAPVGIGLALFIAEMVGVFYTGGSLNPARSLGPCIVTSTFEKEHWIYWVGPVLGTFTAVFFYKFIKILEYEMANPGQDGDDKNDPTKSEKKRLELLERRKHTRGLHSGDL